MHAAQDGAPHTVGGQARGLPGATQTLARIDHRQSAVVDAAGDPVLVVVEAAENCPVSAITVDDAETGERLFP